jgi:mannose-6-phosphate isomerase-like protein (cupin superfamily)
VGIRRVVTGHSQDGKAIFASDEIVEPVTTALTGRAEFFRLWGGDSVSHFPDAGIAPATSAYFPPANGFRFGMFTVAPGSVESPAITDFADAFAELEEKLPGLAAHMEPGNPGMHTTATIDYEYVVSGRVVLELDDGARVELGPGDTVVQNGTRHAWRNPFDQPCVLVVVLVGAHHDRVDESGAVRPA